MRGFSLQFGLKAVVVALALGLSSASVKALGNDDGPKPVQQFVVVNNCPPSFTVENKCSHPVRTFLKNVGGCGCSKGLNCGASFCKANGGATGCGQGCPFKGQELVVEQTQPLQTFTLPQSGFTQSSTCPGGNCPQTNGDFGGWYPGKNLPRNRR